MNFISQHHELTESEVFFELPIALQAEIFDCVWTQPPPVKSSTMEQLLPSAASPDSSNEDRQRLEGTQDLQNVSRVFMHFFPFFFVISENVKKLLENDLLQDK